jgi:hypothetical protein
LFHAGAARITGISDIAGRYSSLEEVGFAWDAAGDQMLCVNPQPGEPGTRISFFCSLEKLLIVLASDGGVIMMGSR